MAESVKLRNSIIEKLDAIKGASFDETTIKGLLIDIREYIRGAAILRELADFIAHPKRDRGISHKLLNSRYAKLSLVEEQMKKLDENNGWENVKTEWDYSNAVLCSISTDRIESRLFKILFVDGIEDVSEGHLKKYYKMGRKEILKMLENSYFESDGFHILKNLKNRAVIDDILKFIRGAVSGKAAFSESSLVKDFDQAIKMTITKFDIEPSYMAAINGHINDILLCIISLLHDARLTFYDGHEARIFLGAVDGRIILGTEGTVFQFTLFASSLSVQNYLKHEDFLALSGSNEELKQINARRNRDGKLVLIE